jgi:thymidine phosphorylase
LDIPAMKKVVEKENGCIIWGGSVSLSPADDILIRVEHAIDLDGEGQLVASVLSKKIAVGSTHVIIDIPVGLTAKVRSTQMANLLKNYLETIGQQLGIKVQVIFTDGLQPVGRGMGPALEAKDVLKVLQGDKDAPMSLRDRALMLAGYILEFSPKVACGTGKQIAQTILDSGQAWQKFQAICKAQGGMFEPPTAAYTQEVVARKSGNVAMIDNRRLAYIAKLAGAPKSKVAGVELLTPLNSSVQKGQPLFIVHSETPGELDYTITFLKQQADIVQLEDIK